MCVAQVGIIEPQAEARGFGETSGRNPPRRKEAIEIKDDWWSQGESNP